MRSRCLLAVVMLLSSCGDRSVATPPASLDANRPVVAPPSGERTNVTRAAVARAKRAAPLVETVGDDASPARLVVRDHDATVFFTDRGFAASLASSHGHHGIHWTLPGARKVAPVGVGPKAARVNHLVGPRSKWRTNLATYTTVAWAAVWPGIDLEVVPQRGAIEYRFVVSPGADPATIRLHQAGADTVRIVDAGRTLEAEIGDRTLREEGLRCYQTIAGAEVDVACQFASVRKARGGWEYAFAIDPWDRSLPLVIDPVIGWSTYLGGGGSTQSSEQPHGMAVDGSGDIYVSGYSNSSEFPVVGGFDTTLGGNQDVVVAKINGTGTAIVWSTYLGGTGQDQAQGLAIDGATNVYVTGFTNSTDFPTNGGFDTTRGSTEDAFVSKIAANGASLVWSSYLGGSGYEWGYGVAVDASSNVYVTGVTLSADFPNANGLGTIPGMSNAYVTKIAAAGSSITWSSQLGGSSGETGYAIAVDGSNNVYVSGNTQSADFPTTGGFDTTLGGATFSDGFVAKINAAGTSLAWGSYIGGTASDHAYGIALDGSANVYLCGTTFSSDLTTTGGFQTTFGGIRDGFVAKVAAAGSSLTWASYLGGTDIDEARACGVDGSGNLFVAGYTGSGDFPDTAGVYQGASGGGTDAFAARVNTNGTIGWATYLGSTGGDYGYGIAVDPSGNVDVVGETTSNAGMTTAGVIQTTLEGTSDLFIAELSSTGAARSWSTYLGGSTSYDELYGVAVSSSGVFVCGRTTARSFPTPAGYDSTLTGLMDATLTKLNLDGTLAYSTFFGGTSNDGAYACAVDSTGAAILAGSTVSSDIPLVAAFDSTRSGSEGFIAKFTPSGTALTWSSYIGGGSGDIVSGVAVDSANNVYVTGSTSGGTPLTNAFDSILGGTTDGFVAMINTTPAVIWGSYIGGSNVDLPSSIAVDASGSVYITGDTQSTDFPFVNGSDGTLGGNSGHDAFYAKVTTSGSTPTLAISSYLGDTGDDYGHGVAVDASGNIYVAGQTVSSTFPHSGGFDQTFDGSVEGFVTKVNAAGTTLAWSTFLGGTGPDYARAIAVDGSANIYVAGTTSSTSASFPLLNAFDTTGGTPGEAFVAKLASSGTALVWSTFLGGNGADGAYGVGVDAARNTYVIGTTDSSDFPTTGGFDTAFGAPEDGFVTRINAELAQAATCSSNLECASGFCVDGYCCDSACNSTCQQCDAIGNQGVCVDKPADCAGGCSECVSGTCMPNETLCTGNCDTCIGGGTTFSCAANVSACTGNCDSCTGSGNSYSCAANASLCLGTCDVCSGSGTAFSCAADAAACSGTCDACTGAGTNFSCSADQAACVGNCDTCAGSGTVFDCTADQTACIGNCDTCSGSGNDFSCAPDQAACTGNCDTCSGTGNAYSCAADAASCTGDCDVCSGTGTAFSCSADEAMCPGVCSQCLGATTAFSCTFLTTECRAPAGPCDVAENCTGAAVDCPIDGFAGASVQCAPSGGGLCDLPDLCPGNAANCPERVAPDTTTCRAAATDCDVAERCNGSATGCPTDVLQPNTTPCNDGNACTRDDRCTGGACGSSTPSLVITPNPVAFASTIVGMSSAPATVTIQNLDDDGGSLAISAISTSGTAFPIGTNPAPVTLTGGASDTATAAVTFAPATLTTYAETLTVTTTNSACMTFTTALQGTALSADIAVAPLGHDFGAIEVGAAQVEQVFTITNTGTAAFDVQTISLAPAAVFVLSPPTLPATLAPNASTTFRITVVAAPPAGAKASTVTITTSLAGVTSTFDVSAEVTCASCGGDDAGVDPVTPDAGTPNSGEGGGCCDTGGGSSAPTAFVSVLFVGLALRRRRRSVNPAISAEHI